MVCNSICCICALLLTIPAERELESKEAQPGFSLSLLQIIAEPSFRDTHLASALYFKNLIRRRWTVCDLLFLLSKQRLTPVQDQDGNYGLPVDEVVVIKKELIGLMTSVAPNIQSQLGEAIGIIAESDFYERWDTLVDVGMAAPDAIPPTAHESSGPRNASDTRQRQRQ